MVPRTAPAMTTRRCDRGRPDPARLKFGRVPAVVASAAMRGAASSSRKRPVADSARPMAVLGGARQVALATSTASGSAAGPAQFTGRFAGAGHRPPRFGGGVPSAQSVIVRDDDTVADRQAAEQEVGRQERSPAAPAGAPGDRPRRDVRVGARLVQPATPLRVPRAAAGSSAGSVQSRRRGGRRSLCAFRGGFGGWACFGRWAAPLVAPPHAGHRRRLCPHSSSSGEAHRVKGCSPSALVTGTKMQPCRQHTGCRSFPAALGGSVHLGHGNAHPAEQSYRLPPGSSRPTDHRT